MQTWAKRGMQTALVTGGMLMLGVGIANAAEYCPARPTTPLGGSVTLPSHLDCKAVGSSLGQIHQLRSAHPLTRVVGFANRLADPTVPGALPPIGLPSQTPLSEAPALPGPAPTIARRIEPSAWPTALIPRVVDDAPSWVRTPNSAPPQANIPAVLDNVAAPTTSGWITGGSQRTPADATTPLAGLPLPAAPTQQSAPTTPSNASSPVALPLSGTGLPVDAAHPAALLSQPTAHRTARGRMQPPHETRPDLTELTAPLSPIDEMFFGGPIVPAGSPVSGVQLPTARPTAARPVATQSAGAPTAAARTAAPTASTPNAPQSAPAATPGAVPVAHTAATVAQTIASAVANAGHPTALTALPAARSGDMRPRLYPVPSALANLLPTDVHPVQEQPADEILPLRVRGEGLPGPSALPSFPELAVLQASLAPPVLPTAPAASSKRSASARAALPTFTQVALPAIPAVGQFTMPLPPNPGDLPRVQLPVLGGAKLAGLPTADAVPAVQPGVTFPELIAAIQQAQHAAESTTEPAIDLPGPAELPNFPELGALRHSLATAIPMTRSRARSGRSVSLPSVGLPTAGPAATPAVRPQLSVQLPQVDSPRPQLEQNSMSPVPALAAGLLR